MNALQQFLQSASNEAAGAVSGPVDLIGMGLRKLGVPVPRNALMSSEWMKQNGLMQDAPQSGASLAGQTFGLLSPVVAAAKAPQIARGLLSLDDKAMDMTRRGVESYMGKSGLKQNIFMGDLSKTWDKSAAAKALEMEKAGADPRAIWQETGTFKGVDGKWRQEIDDSAAMFNTSTINGVKRENDLINGTPGFDYGPINGLLDHDALKAGYGTGLTKSTFVGNKNTMFGDGVQGAYDDAAGALTINAPAKAADARSTVLHELQHAVQGREGFARGGSPKDMPLVLEDLTDKASKEARTLFDIARRNDPLNPGDVVKPGVLGKALGKEKEALRMRQWLERINSFGDGYANDAYRRLAGEAEARAVQKRMNMNSLQRRETFPLDSYDVPINELIVRR